MSRHQLNGFPKPGMLLARSFSYERSLRVGGKGTARENARDLLDGYKHAKGIVAGMDSYKHFTLLLEPGTYEFDPGELVLDTDFINLICLPVNAEADFDAIPTTWPRARLISSGITLRTVAPASSFVVMGVEIYTSTSTSPTNKNSIYAYYPDYDGLSQYGTFINCLFTSSGDDDPATACPMRTGVTYYGLFINCRSSHNAFGASLGSDPLGISGSFFGCHASSRSFGYLGGSGNLSSVSGRFVDCTGGDYCFGYRSSTETGSPSNIDGTWIRCVGDDYCFGTGGPGTVYIAGTFVDCEGGAYCFGSTGDQAIAHTRVLNGTFIRCKSGDYGFGGQSAGGTGTITLSGRFEHCVSTQLSWGADEFAAGLSVTGSGIFLYCDFGDFSWNAPTVTFTGTAKFCWFGESNLPTLSGAGALHSCYCAEGTQAVNLGYGAIKAYESGKLEVAPSVAWHNGNGSPEGVVTAAVGSFYVRKNGGAGTTFYIKESGAGNTGWVTASTGGAPPSGANPTASVGLTAVNGVASTFMRSDAAPPLAPELAAPGKLFNAWNFA